jgi:hypothetical protein
MFFKWALPCLVVAAAVAVRLVAAVVAALPTASLM